MPEEKTRLGKEYLKSLRENFSAEMLAENIRKNPAVWTRFFLEVEIQGVVTDYLDSLSIPLARANGPYYLIDCHDLYTLKGMDIGPQMIFIVADFYSRRGCHVRRALHLLAQKIIERDPYTAQ